MKTNLSQIAYNDIKWNENKALWSKKNQKLIGTDRIRRTLRCGHGIVNVIRQRLKDMELQRWLSEINNDTSVRRDFS